MLTVVEHRNDDGQLQVLLGGGPLRVGLCSGQIIVEVGRSSHAPTLPLCGHPAAPRCPLRT